MKWSNLYKLKRGWVVDSYDIEKGIAVMYHEGSGLSNRVCIPPMFIQIAKAERKRGYDERGTEIRNALGIEESWL